MSAILGLIAAAIVTGVVLPAGAKLVRRSVKGLSGKLDAGTATSYDRPSFSADLTNLDSIKSVSQLRSEFKPIASRIPKGVDVETAKEKILEELASRPFCTEDAASIDRKVAGLKNASTIEEVERAGAELTATIEDKHQAVFAGVLKSACERASTKIGFAKIEALPSPLSSGITRFAATDGKGRSLVTEIKAPKSGDVKIDTEVLGVNDNSCHHILDVFHAALKAEGVDLTGAPKREGTGGICTLAAAKMFVQTKLVPETRADAPVRVAERRGQKDVRRKRPSQKLKLRITS